MEPEAASDTGFDLESSVTDISSSLGFDKPDPSDQPELDLEPAAAAPETPVITTPTVRPPPKSWAKDYHEHWAKTDPKVQEYIEKREKDFLDGTEQYRGESAYAKQLRQILDPYKAVFQAQGVDEFKAVQYLTNAHYRLTNGTAEERRSAYDQIGRDLGLIQGQAAAQVDPAVAQLQKELNGIKSTLTARQQADLQSAKADADREIETFKADTSHPYFDELESDMIPYIEAGASLTDAYDKAVWANPVTRQKELARIQTEGEAKLKEKAKAEAQAARAAASTNIRGTDSRKAPTEPLGSMDDTLRETLGTIRKRAH